jgi:hypothetical protein
MISKIPIYNGSDFYVWFPTIEFFINKIKNNDPFSLIRFNVDFWMLIDIALKDIKMKWSRDLTEDSLKALADQIKVVFQRKQNNNKSGYTISSDVFFNVLKYLIKDKPKNFYLSVSDRTYHYGHMPPGKTQWSEHIPQLIRKILPPNEVPFTSLVWKTWAKTGQLNKLFTELPNEHFVVVGPEYHKVIGEKVGLSNFTHVQVNTTNASAYIDKTIEQVKALHRELRKKHDKVIYICSGGAPVIWLICYLHNKLDGAFFIDIGRALDVYVSDEKIIRSTPKWMWGGWLKDTKGFPPRWIRDLSAKLKKR